MSINVFKGFLFSVFFYTHFMQAMNGLFCIEVGGEEQIVSVPGATEQDMKRSFITVTVADALFDKEQWSKALTYYQQALENKGMPAVIRAQVLVRIAKILTIGDLGEYPVQLDFKKALTSLQEAAKISNIPNELLGIIHKNIALISTVGGDRFEPDFQMARHGFKRFLGLIDAKDPRRALSLYFLGKNYYLGGHGAKKDHNKAIKCYSEAMALRRLDPEAHKIMHCHFGNIYAFGVESNVVPDYARAFMHLKIACSSANSKMLINDVFGCINKVMSACGHTIPFKLKEHALMNFYLGKMLYRTRKCFEKDWPQAVGFFQKAINPEVHKRLQVEGHYCIGKALYSGADDLQKDWLRALQHFRNILVLTKDKDKSVRAHKYIASILTRGGYGINRNHKAAFLHWQHVLKARDKRDYTTAVAHIHLGCLYAGKSIGKPDVSKALAHLRCGNVSQAGAEFQKYAQRKIYKLEKKNQVPHMKHALGFVEPVELQYANSSYDTSPCSFEMD